MFRAALTLVVLACVSPTLSAQPFGFGGRGLGRWLRGIDSPSVSLLFLSRRSEVLEELNLSREQEAMLDALRLDLMTQARGRGDRSALKPEITEKLFSTVLNESQTKRFEELRLQFEGLRAFDRRTVRTALRVTDEQMARIRDLRRSKPDQASNEEQLAQVLTDEQLGNWTAMVGEPFEFSEQIERFRQLMRRGDEVRGGRGEGPRR